MILYLVCFFILLCLVITLFLNFNPAFGGKLTREQKEKYNWLDNYAKGKFINWVRTEMNMSFADLISMFKDSIAGSKGSKPYDKIEVDIIDWDKIKSEKDSFTWLGHSSFLISIDNKKLLMDPILSSMASPVSFAGSKKYKYSEDMDNIMDEMPPIDAVFISHDHYDHLDYSTILKLKSKTSHFFVPLGVSVHLIRWGIGREKIINFFSFSRGQHGFHI
jgi:Predicted Zn-dependent hydrolases of the beta-lactamase fold